MGHMHATRPGPARRFCSAGRLFSMLSSPTIELRSLGVEPSHPNAPLLLLLVPVAIVPTFARATVGEE